MVAGGIPGRLEGGEVMKALNHKIRRYWPVLVLGMLVVICFVAPNIITTLLLREGYQNKMQMVDMMAAGIDTDINNTPESHERALQESIKYLDSIPLTFAAAYKPSQSVFELLTDRDMATNFDPFTYEAVYKAVLEADSGELVVGFTPSTGSTAGKYRDMHLYFRWMPEYAEKEQRYLVIVAVSKYSIQSSSMTFVSFVLWGVIAVIAAPAVYVSYVAARLGVVRKLRKGDEYYAYARKGGDNG